MNKITPSHPKHILDNRSNQLNPQHPEYHHCRGADPSLAQRLVQDGQKPSPLTSEARSLTQKTRQTK